MDSKKGDPRHPWFKKKYGRKCWELDAMSPNDLRERVEMCIRSLIDMPTWERCAQTEKLEEASLRDVLTTWNTGRSAN